MKDLKAKASVLSDLIDALETHLRGHKTMPAEITVGDRAFPIIAVAAGQHFASISPLIIVFDHLGKSRDVQLVLDKTLAPEEVVVGANQWTSYAAPSFYQTSTGLLAGGAVTWDEVGDDNEYPGQGHFALGPICDCGADKHGWAHITGCPKGANK